MEKTVPFIKGRGGALSLSTYLINELNVWTVEPRELLDCHPKVLMSWIYTV